MDPCLLESDHISICGDFIYSPVSILGIPFAFECIKRYDISSRGQGLKPGEGQLTWLGSRGYFLMTWNGVSFFGVKVVLLPPLTLVGIVLLIPHKCYLVLGYPKGKVFPAYRRAIQGLMSSLFFTYFSVHSTYDSQGKCEYSEVVQVAESGVCVVFWIGDCPSHCRCGDRFHVHWHVVRAVEQGHLHSRR